jgi:hypothetical protein
VAHAPFAIIAQTALFLRGIVELMPYTTTDNRNTRMPLKRLRLFTIILSVALWSLISGCGGGSGGSGGNASTPAPGGDNPSPVPTTTPSSTSLATAAARVNDLNTFRGQAGGTALPVVASHNALIIAAIRHAGWQAIDDATQPGRNLNHGEPRANALFTANHFADRIRSANGGANISGFASYYEDIASTAGNAAITNLWNTVYHRIPMMRHRATHLGYGDMEMARSDYSTAAVPALDEWNNSPSGNGYATLDWAGYSTPAITWSFWPANGTTHVPRTFATDTESPDPHPTRNHVGCPLHIICPVTSGEFTTVDISFQQTSGPTIPVYVLAGGSAPSGSANQVATLVADARLARGELFAMPIPDPNNTGLSASTSYTYRIQVTVSGQSFDTGNVTFTTAP